MSKIKAELKRVLDALAYQDAADFLSESDKNRVLGLGVAAGAEAVSPNRREPAANLRRRKRIAMITDGRGGGAPLAFAADACKRQDAGLDIVLHGPAGDSKALMRAARQMGIEAQIIELQNSDVEMLAEYICNHPSLVYMVGISDDELVRALTERVLPARGGRMHVPLVMIEDRPVQNLDLKAVGSD